MTTVVSAYGLKGGEKEMTIWEILALEEYTTCMRNFSLSTVVEVKWTDEELEDPEKQSLILSGTRRWQCTTCKKETLHTLPPRGCLHYHKLKNLKLSHMVFPEVSY